MSRRCATVPIVAALALLAGGCAGSVPPPPATVAPAAAVSANAWDVTVLPDPCRVLTLPEVRGVLGAAVSGGTRLQSWPPLCRYVLDRGHQTYLYVSDDSRPAAADDFAGDRQGTGSVVPVAGVGDQAYWLPRVYALHVLRGPTHLVVSFRGGAIPGDAEARAGRLARLALPRAPG